VKHIGIHYSVGLASLMFPVDINTKYTFLIEFHLQNYVIQIVTQQNASYPEMFSSTTVMLVLNLRDKKHSEPAVVLPLTILLVHSNYFWLCEYWLKKHWL
jgi:hypothetical protein